MDLVYLQKVNFKTDNITSYLPVNISQGYTCINNTIVSLEESTSEGNLIFEPSGKQYFENVSMSSLEKYKRYNHWSILSGASKEGSSQVILLYKQKIIETLES